MRILVVVQWVLLALGCLSFAQALGAAHDGDVNLDGHVNAVDVLWGEESLAGTRTLSTEEEAHGDVAPLVGGIPQPNGAFDDGDLEILFRIAFGSLDFSIPGNQFNVGDSIGEGEAADGTIGEPHHETVWSTGYDGSDVVISFNERFEAIDAVHYYENNADRDALFNHAVSGAQMADFVAQAQAIVAAAAQTPSGRAGMITVLLGANDVCAPSLGEMTDPALFEAQYRAGLDALAASNATKNAQIHVSGLPAIYWLWDAKYSRLWCRVFVWPFVPCQDLLASPADDCASSVSREDPNTIYPGDGVNCQRRKQFHAIIRDTYNPILRDVLAEYRDSGRLPNARYTDIYDIRFGSQDVNDGDCFHPSTTGHALLAETEWCRTHWGHDDPTCSE